MQSSKARAPRFERAPWRLLCAAALACFPLGCSADPEPAVEAGPRVWVGEVRGTDAKVALADRDGTAALFFCGGDDSYTYGTRWFNDVALLTRSFSFIADGWSVDGGVESGKISGTLQIEADTAREWSVEPADPRTIAGLYEGVAPCGKLGLIVTQATPDDEPTGQGACLRVEDEARIVEQVNPVRLELSSKRELSVTVVSAPDERFTVRPVAGAPP